MFLLLLSNDCVLKTNVIHMIEDTLVNLVLNRGLGRAVTVSGATRAGTDLFKIFVMGENLINR